MTDLETVLRLKPRAKAENSIGVSIGVTAALFFIAVTAATAFRWFFA